MEPILRQFKTTVLVCDEPTITGRIYPFKETKVAIKKNKALKELLLNNMLFGNYITEIIAKENLNDIKNIAFRVDKLYWHGKKLMANVSLLNTPQGRIVDNMMNLDANVILTIAGTGDVDPETNKVSNYKLENFYMIEETN